MALKFIGEKMSSLLLPHTVPKTSACPPEEEVPKHFQQQNGVTVVPHLRITLKIHS